MLLIYCICEISGGRPWICFTVSKASCIAFLRESSACWRSIIIRRWLVWWKIDISCTVSSKITTWSDWPSILFQIIQIFFHLIPITCSRYPILWLVLFRVIWSYNWGRFSCLCRGVWIKLRLVVDLTSFGRDYSIRHESCSHKWRLEVFQSICGTKNCGLLLNSSSLYRSLTSFRCMWSFNCIIRYKDNIGSIVILMCSHTSSWLFILNSHDTCIQFLGGRHVL